MDGQEVQPTRISKDEYARFKQWVRDVHGMTRGHLSTEIENALREYRQEDHERDKLARIEDDIATIKAQLAVAESDGGTDVEAQSARPRDNTKPNANAPRDEKVNWIVNEYYSRGGGSLTRDVIQEHVQSEYSFSDEVATEYVDLVLAELDAENHPDNKSVFAWGTTLEERREDTD